ncbi:hypothetical protein AVEN_154101-1 [Araneus ventricosus]|uniref:Uncharacterized protein n=1 Tax=Araneus ventricosus TaxID=182803 RepID=A0A4Y2TE97_ARAVE|nr:hypothetical protein AVEN_154101-1 [Araneus ventricosus]
MSQRSDLLKRKRNRAAARRQKSEEEKNEKRGRTKQLWKERAKQLWKERAKRYYEKNKQKKNFITNYFQINEGASISGVNPFDFLNHHVHLNMVPTNYPNTLLSNSFIDLTFTRKDLLLLLTKDLLLQNC